MSIVAEQPLLIIAAGKRQRGDDAAGPLILDRLPRPLPQGVITVELGDDPLGALPVLAASRRVVAVDAMRSGAAPGTIRHFHGAAGLEQAGPLASGTHAFGIRELFAVAAAVDSCPTEVTVIGVEGRTFRLGQPLSPEVELAIVEVAGEIAREIGAATVSQ